MSGDATATAPAARDSTSPGRSGRAWLWINVAVLVAMAGTWLLLQAALRRDCLRAQAKHGQQGAFCGGALAEQLAALPDPALDWRHGVRRELLLAAVERARWLWPIAAADDVRRGAAQLLVESARALDAARVADAVAAGHLDPCFGALHFALAASETWPSPPPALSRALEGGPREQLFGAVALAMLTGERACGLERHLYDPLPPEGDGAAQAAACDALSRRLFGLPLADAVARSIEELASARVRPRGEVVALLAICPRTWGLF